MRRPFPDTIERGTATRQYTEGDPQIGTRPTKVSGQLLNILWDELCHVVEFSGDSLDDTGSDTEQIRRAVQSIAGAFAAAEADRAVAFATAGLLSGGLTIRENNPPSILAGRYEVDGKLISPLVNAPLTWLEHSAGDSAPVNSAHYVVSLRADGIPVVRLYYGDQIIGALDVQGIRDAGDGRWDILVPNSTDLAQVFIGAIVVMRGAPAAGNNGLFAISALDDNPDSAGAGLKYVRISNSRGAVQNIAGGLLDIHYRAESETDVADTDLYNPIFDFDEARNQYADGYESSIGNYARVIGTFYINSAGTVERVYSLGNGREWQEAEGLPVGVPIPVPYSHCPPWAIDADGRQDLNRDRYRRLFNRLGTAFGAGDGATTFGIFDARGNVIRGQDRGRGRDPDAATRSPRADGTGGDVPGSEQNDQNVSHSHHFYSWVPNGPSHYLVGHGITWLGLTDQGTGASGGAEARMRNVSMRYVCKY